MHLSVRAVIHQSVEQCKRGRHCFTFTPSSNNTRQTLKNVPVIFNGLLLSCMTGLGPTTCHMDHDRLCMVWLGWFAKWVRATTGLMLERIHAVDAS